MEASTEDSAPRFSTSDAADERERNDVRQRLIAFNIAAMPQFFNPDAREPHINLYVHDAGGQLLAGLVAPIEWRQLCIDYLWVDESLRGQGIGRELVRRAEVQARQQGCTYAELTTFDFQAYGFYLKLGYRVVGQFDDHPPGHTYYFLRHDFDAGP